MTRPFDASLLTRSESEDVAFLLQQLDEFGSPAALLLGPIPVLDEDGTQLLGYLKQGDDWQWRFLAPPALRLEESLLPPPRRHVPEYDPHDGGDDAA